MKLLIKITAILLVVIMLASPIFGLMDGGMVGDMMSRKAKDMMNKGMELRSRQGVMGMGFMQSERNSYGNYVTFSVDNTTGTVMNYGISGVTIFDSIKVANFDFKDSTTMDALTRITNKDGSVVIQLHDNPVAVINIITKGAATVTFDLADGVKASREENAVKLEAGDLTAYIAAMNDTSVNIVGGEIKIESNRGNAIFRALPVNMPMYAMHQNFIGELMENRAGAEVFVGISDKYSIVNYIENMNVMINSIDRNRMRMTIYSTDPSGKLIMINLDNSSFTMNEGEKMRFYLDNRTMRKAMTAQELYDSKESSFLPDMPGGNRMQAIMYIANFSERVVDIVVEDGVKPAGTPEAKTPVSTPATPGFEIVLGLIGTGLAYQLGRKR